jgi:divalent metal cation (Fe/Co/Zn/Cd) transporter
VLKIGEAHAVAHAVEDYLKKQYPKAIDIIIHVEPYKG